MLAAVVQYASPDYAAPPVPTHGVARLRAALRNPKRGAAVLAILIGFASILSAVIAWRASLASIDASRYESLAVQQEVRRQQIEHELQGLIAQDLRFVNVYQEHVLAARELSSQAESLREGDPAAADELDLEAQSHLDQARAVLPFFLGASGVTLGEDGVVAYDEEYVFQNLSSGNAELRDARTQQTTELGARAARRSVGLVGVGTLVVAALFFLTIAQVSRRRELIRQAFFVAGGVLVLVGTAGFVIVEIVA